MAEQHLFLDDLNIVHGPSDLLSRYFLAATGMLDDVGIRLSFATAEELAEANRQNRHVWFPLLPTFDPDRWKLTNENFIGLLGRDRNGDIVAAQAARRFQWVTTNLAQETESLRIFYPDPVRDRQPGEMISMTAPTAKLITGNIVFTGAVWFRPDWRGRGMTRLVPPIARMLALTQWNVDYAVAFMKEAVHHGGASSRAQHGHAEFDLHLINTVVGERPVCLAVDDRDRTHRDVSSANWRVC